MLIGWLKPLYESDDGGGTGGEEGGKVRASELRAQLGMTIDEQALTRLLEKHADVLNDNYRLRTQRQTLKQQLTEVQGKVTPEGSTVLTADDAKIWETYRALGKPDALKQAIDANGMATAELTALKREKILAKAAEAVGFKASVLATLAGDLDIRTKADKDGKPLAVVVKDGAETPLRDHATKEWADFMPALETKTDTVRLAPDINGGARGNGHGAPETRGIVQF